MLFVHCSYKVTTCTELVHVNRCPCRKYLARFLWAFDHVFINRSICNLVTCAFLFKDTWLNIYCWFINTELLDSRVLTQAWRELVSYICFRHKASHSQDTGQARQYFSTVLEGHFKGQNHQWKAYKWKNSANWTVKGSLFTLWWQKQEGSFAPCSAPPGNVCIGHTGFQHTAHEWATAKAPRVLILELQIRFSK